VKILVRATNWVGDVVMSLPAVRALRASFPKMELAVLARPWVADLYRILPEVNRVILEDPKGTHAGSEGRARLVSELKVHEFDRAVCLPSSFGTAWTLWRARIPERIGYANELRSPLLTRALRGEHRPGEHQVFRHLRLAEAAGASRPDPLDASLPVSDAVIARARALLHETGWANEPFLAAHVASFAHAAKRWPIARFAAVFDALSAQGITTVLLGSGGEAVRNAEAAALARTANVLDLAGKTTLPETVAVLRLARGFLGNDSGVAHLAAAAGTPATVVFGPTDPLATRPLGSGEGGAAPVSIVRQPPLCAPCRFRVCPIDHRCMRSIGSDRVLEIVRAALLA
jgi:heptosyltransferase-2